MLKRCLLRRLPDFPTLPLDKGQLNAERRERPWDFSISIKSNKDGTMSVEAFVVAFHDGYWRIAYDSQWYGLYPNRASAERAAVNIAKQMGELPTRVVARESDGTEEVVWQPANHGIGKPTAQ